MDTTIKLSPELEAILGRFADSQSRLAGAVESMMSGVKELNATIVKKMAELDEDKDLQRREREIRIKEAEFRLKQAERMEAEDKARHERTMRDLKNGNDHNNGGHRNQRKSGARY